MLVGSHGRRKDEGCPTGQLDGAEPPALPPSGTPPATSPRRAGSIPARLSPAPDVVPLLAAKPGSPRNGAQPGCGFGCIQPATAPGYLPAATAWAGSSTAARKHARGNECR